MTVLFTEQFLKFHKIKVSSSSWSSSPVLLGTHNRALQITNLLLNISPFIICCFKNFVCAFWLLLTNRHRTTCLASQLPPLSCYRTEHSQLNEVGCFHALWNAILLQSLNVQSASKIVHILLKINCNVLHACWGNFIFVLLVLHWFWNQNWRFILQMDSEIRVRFYQSQLSRTSLTVSYLSKLIRLK